ncbi:glycerate kinase family protein [Alicyclobacillus suci]|uniref:glycerate kinase family protein n=1 Tax=Alicyclobacillus suci TaxID=2816080 RepID=UPI001A8E644B|nr:glycerate kinase [Alicyclobacillus suci]
MRLLVASDSFKGSLTSSQVIEAVQEAANRCGEVEVRGIPVADGGEGTLESILAVLPGRKVNCAVLDPLGRSVETYFAVVGRTAIVEMAKSSGLPLLAPHERNPLLTTSYGLGQLIARALEVDEVEELIVGIGGSATNDGGLGMLQALGLRALDAANRELPFGGQHLALLRSFDVTQLHPRLKEVRIRVMCDVTNPLCGEAGASAVYGPQKGADAEMIRMLDENLRHLATCIKEILGMDVADMPGAGAAGGVGAALLAFCQAKLEPGIEVVLDLFQFDEMVQHVDLIFTGEGRTDQQTLYGKVVSGVARRARCAGKPVVCLSGSLSGDLHPLYQHGVSALFSICPGPVAEETAMTHAYEYLTVAAENVIRLWQSHKALC